MATLINRLKSTGLIIASHNPGKVTEISELLEPLGIPLKTAQMLGLIEPEETGRTFIANAALKAQTAADAAGLPALADDSGLEVEALSGDPGIYSARWAGPDRDFGRAMQKVREAMGDNPNRYARFQCVLALAEPHGRVHIFEGTIAGEVVWPPRGIKGFGYDPMFKPEGSFLTFGEMEPHEKHRDNHRARAFRAFLKALDQEIRE